MYCPDGSVPDSIGGCFPCRFCLTHPRERGCDKCELGQLTTSTTVTRIAAGTFFQTSGALYTTTEPQADSSVFVVVVTVTIISVCLLVLILTYFLYKRRHRNARANGDEEAHVTGSIKVSETFVTIFGRGLKTYTALKTKPLQDRHPQTLLVTQSNRPENPEPERQVKWPKEEPEGQPLRQPIDPDCNADQTVNETSTGSGYTAHLSRTGESSDDRVSLQPANDDSNKSEAVIS